MLAVSIGRSKSPGRVINLSKMSFRTSTSWQGGGAGWAGPEQEGRLSLLLAFCLRNPATAPMRRCFESR